jgi:hypothetical protein
VAITSSVANASQSAEAMLAALEAEAAQVAPAPAAPTAGAPSITPILDTTGDPADYDSLFAAAGEKYGVPPALLKAIAKTESNFNPRAKSPVGASGLMQFMPGTAKEYGIDPLDPVQAIDGAARYMKKHIDLYEGDFTRAVAAYNAGAGNVNKGRFPKETRDYVPKVQAAYEAYSSGAQPSAQQAPVEPQFLFNPDTNTGVINGHEFDTTDRNSILKALELAKTPKAGGDYSRGFYEQSPAVFENLINQATTSDASIGGTLKSAVRTGLNVAGGYAPLIVDTISTALANGDPNSMFADFKAANPGTALADFMGLNKVSLGDQAADATLSTLTKTPITDWEGLKTGFSEASAGGIIRLAANAAGSIAPLIAGGWLSGARTIPALIGGLGAGGSNAQQTYDDLLARPDKDWEGITDYKQMVDSGVSPEVAKRYIARTASVIVGLVTAPVASLDAFLPGVAPGVATKAMMGNIRNKAILGGIKTAAFEGAQEGAESFVQKATQNEATGLNDDPTKGLALDILGGALAGGPIGATVAGMETSAANSKEASIIKARDLFNQKVEKQVEASRQETIDAGGAIQLGLFGGEEPILPEKIAENSTDPLVRDLIKKGEAAMQVGDMRMAQQHFMEADKLNAEQGEARARNPKQPNLFRPSTKNWKLAETPAEVQEVAPDEEFVDEAGITEALQEMETAPALNPKIMAEQSGSRAARKKNVTMPDAEISALATQLRDDSEDKYRGSVMPYSGTFGKLHALIKAWDDKKNTQRAGTKTQQALVFSNGPNTRRGLANQLEAQFDQMVEQYGMDNIDAVIRNIKSFRYDPKTKSLVPEDKATKESQRNTRLSIAWRQYRDGQLGANEGGGNIQNSKIRGNYSTPVADEAKLETIMNTVGKNETVRKDPISGRRLPVAFVGLSEDTKRALRVMNYIEGRSTSSVARQITSALRTLIEKTRADFKIVISNELGPRSSAGGVNGMYDPDTDTITLYKNGQNERTLLHEITHAVSLKYLADNYGKGDPAVDALRDTLASLTDAVEVNDAAERFIKSEKLNAYEAGDLRAALMDTVDKFGTTKNKKTYKADQIHGLAEFLTYGMTLPVFQDFLKSIKVKSKSDFDLQTGAQKNRAGEPRLSLWSKMVNALSHIFFGKGYTPAQTDLLGKFLGDTGALFSAIYTANTGMGATGLKPDTNTSKSLKGAKLYEITSRVSQATREAAAAKKADEAMSAEQAAARRKRASSEASATTNERMRARAEEDTNANSIFYNTARGKMWVPGVLDKITETIFRGARVDKLTKGVWNVAGQASDRMAAQHPMYRGFLQNTVSGYGLPEIYRTAIHALKSGRTSVIKNINHFSQAFASVPIDEQLAVMAVMYAETKGEQDALLDNMTAEQQKTAKVAITELKTLIGNAVEAGVFPTDLNPDNLSVVLKNYNLKKLLANPGKTGLRRGVGIEGTRVDQTGAVATAPRDNILTSASGKYRQVQQYFSDGSTTMHYIPFEQKNLDAFPAEAEVEFTDDSNPWRILDDSSSANEATLYRPYTNDEMKEKGFVTDPRYILHATMHQLMQDTMHADMFNFISGLGDTSGLENKIAFDSLDAAENFERDNVLAPQDWVQVPNTNNGAGGKKYGTLAGKFIPKSIWLDISAQIDNAPIFPTFDKWLTRWKLLKTAYSPVTHFNNMASNTAIAFFHDIPAGNIVAAAKIYRTIAKGNESPELDAAIKALDEFDAAGGSIGSWGASEIRREQMLEMLEELATNGTNETAGLNKNAALAKAMELLEHGKASALGKAGKYVVSRGPIMYELEDNVFRMASYMTHIQNGLSQKEAGRRASEDFVDYNITAPWINKARGSVLPFISWPYRMVPIMLRTVAEKPWKLATLTAMIYGFNALSYMVSGGDEEKERALMAERYKGGLGHIPFLPNRMVRMPFSNTFFDASVFFPLGDILNADGSGVFGLPMLRTLTPNGPLVAIIEAVFGFNFYQRESTVKPTNTHTENLQAVMGQFSRSVLPDLPGVPNSYATQKVLDAIRDKHGLSGAEENHALRLLSMLGPKIVEFDEKEQRVQQGLALQREMREYSASITKVYRDNARRGNKDVSGTKERAEELKTRRDERIRELLGR